MKFKYFLILLSLIAFNVSFAETPKVNYFSASRTSVTSRQPVGFSWSVENGSAPFLTFVCPLGVKLVTANGSSVSCNTDTLFSSNRSDAVDLLVTNTRSFSQTLAVKLIPRDINGTSYGDMTRTIYLSVTGDQGPITDFTVKPDATSGIRVKNYEPVVFSWSAISALEGVNFQINCNDNIQASSSVALDSSDTSRILYCGRPLFSTPLSVSGSSTFYLYNRIRDYSDIKFTILPYIGSGVYDTGHSKTITLSLERNIMPDPSVSVSVSSNRVLNQATTTLSWSAYNTAGLNIKFSCRNNIKIFNLSTTTPEEIVCDRYIFSEPTSASSSMSFKIVNNNTNQDLVTFSLVPMIIGGGYNGIFAKTVSIVVEARDYKGNIIQDLSNTKTPIQSPQNNSSGKYGYMFNRPMYLGLRSNDVLELQKSLSRFKDIYPEGLATGYFGPATERAVKRFQEKYSLAKIGDSGYGFVGPKTRAKLSEI